MSTFQHHDFEAIFSTWNPDHIGILILWLLGIMLKANHLYNISLKCGISRKLKQILEISKQNLWWNSLIVFMYDLKFVCLIVWFVDLRFYGCCHPCYLRETVLCFIMCVYVCVCVCVVREIKSRFIRFFMFISEIQTHLYQ